MGTSEVFSNLNDSMISALGQEKAELQRFPGALPKPTSNVLTSNRTPADPQSEKLWGI